MSPSYPISNYDAPSRCLPILQFALCLLLWARFSKPILYVVILVLVIYVYTYISIHIHTENPTSTHNLLTIKVFWDWLRCFGSLFRYLTLSRKFEATFSIIFYLKNDKFGREQMINLDLSKVLGRFVCVRACVLQNLCHCVFLCVCLCVCEREKMREGERNIER